MKYASAKEDLLPLVTPGEILETEFMQPYSLSAYKVAKAMHTTQIAISQIIKGTRAITPEMALRLGTCFGTTAKFWLNLQSDYSLRKIEREGRELPEIQRLIAA